MQQNAILVVDDDEDDLGLIGEAVTRLNITRPVHYFRSGNELYQHLLANEASPFLIICDVNLPQDDGFSVRKRIAENEEIKYKSVPFIFWSNGATEKQIQHAYDLPAQGFFIKPSDFEELCETLQTILIYWQKSQHPKRVL